MILTVDVEPGGVPDGARPVGHRARVLPAVLDAHAADVDVAHHVAVDRHVLPDKEPEMGCYAMSLLSNPISFRLRIPPVKRRRVTGHNLTP